MNVFRQRLALRGRLIQRNAVPPCEHRAGFTQPMRVPLPKTGREAIVASCLDRCGRSFFILHDGKTTRTLEGVKATLYRRDPDPGEDGGQDFGDVSHTPMNGRKHRPRSSKTAAESFPKGG